MTFTPITAYDTLSNPTRLGGAGYILNVNAGSKDAADYSQLGNASFMDMCWHQGNLHVVHCEIDTSITYLGGHAFRGPYVHKWNGSSWSAVGGTLDSGADSVPASIGDRWRAIRPRIASDGTHLFVSYTDSVITNVGSGAATKWVRIAAWNGSSWSDVASRQFSDGNTTFAALCVKSGLAYAVYYENASTAITGQTITVLRSDGSSMVNLGHALPTSIAFDNGGAPGAVVTRAGRPVGFFNTSPGAPGFFAITRAVLFDLDTGAVIVQTQTSDGPSPMVPYGTNSDGGTDKIAGSAILYGTDQIAVSDGAHGVLTTQENGSGPIVALGGADYLHTAGAYTDGQTIALDTVDPLARQLWTVAGTVNAPSAIRGPDNVYVWRAACSSHWVPGTPDNTGPAYEVANVGSPLPYPDAYILANPFFWTYFGPACVATDSSNLYTGILYNPTGASPPPTPPQVYWSQFIVYVWPINRAAGSCSPSYSAPDLHTRFKAAL